MFAELNFLGAVAFGMPFIAWNIFVLNAVSSRVQFAQPYFFCFTIATVNNILNWVVNIIRCRLSIVFVSFFVSLSNTFVLSLLSFLHTFFFHVHLSALFCMSLNRYTAICMPLKHSDIWQNYKQKIAIGVICVPFILTSPLLAFNVRAQYLRGTQYAFIDYANHHVQFVLEIEQTVTSVLFCIVTCVISLTSFIVLVRDRSDSQSSVYVHKLRTTEFALSLVSLFDIVLLVFYIAIVMYISLSAKTLDDVSKRVFFVIVTPIVMDLRQLPSPTFLVIFSSTVRRAIHQNLLDWLPWDNRTPLTTLPPSVVRAKSGLRPRTVGY